MLIYEAVNDRIGAVELIDFMGSDMDILNAARVSFNNDRLSIDVNGMTLKDERLIRYLLVNKHTSPFEHCVLKFHFVVPLFVRSQLHRHRTWAYNEVSRRYTSENLQFYIPNILYEQHESNKQARKDDAPIYTIPTSLGKATIPVVEYLRDTATFALNRYDRLIEAGVAREQARMVLPQNLYTRYYGTVNLHNFMHWLKLRDHPHAQWETQQVAKAARQLVTNIFPVTMKIFNELQG